MFVTGIHTYTLYTDTHIHIHIHTDTYTHAHTHTYGCVVVDLSLWASLDNHSETTCS